MKLLIIAGFLGSGKTTLLLQIARRLSSDSQKIAIIENEMGEIGIDGEYLSLEGLHVQELFGGCICCTLSIGLIETLDQVEQQYQPDLAIIEATGAARPGDIKANVHKYRPELGCIQVITLVDAARYEMLMEVMSPLITAQIQTADIVAVNKIDRVQPETTDQILQQVACLNPQANVMAISIDKGTQLNPLMAALI